MVPIQDKKQALIDIKRAWNRLRLSISRKFGKFKYCWTLEAQPGTGMPHMHVLLDRYVNQKWLSGTASHAGFGSICDIRKVKDNAVMGYVVKYTTKGLGSSYLERLLKELRGRRVGFARGMALEAPETKHWVAMGVAEMKDSSEQILRRMELALAAAGKKTEGSVSSKNWVSVRFDKDQSTEEEAYWMEEFSKAEIFKAQQERHMSQHAKLVHWDKWEPHSRMKPIGKEVKEFFKGLTHSVETL